jgi:hypothetical protein
MNWVKGIAIAFCFLYFEFAWFFVLQFIQRRYNWKPIESFITSLLIMPIISVLLPILLGGFLADTVFQDVFDGKKRL